VAATMITVARERDPPNGPCLTGCFPVVYATGMLIVHVNVHVKAECIEAFKQITLENARESVKEPGIARFDVVQQADDPTRFILVEAYRTTDAQAKHRETAHYAKWRDTVAPMMAEPRRSVKYGDVFWTG